MYNSVLAPKHILQGWPRSVRMNLSSPIIKYVPLSFQVGKEARKTAMEVQKSSASWDTAGTALEVGTRKLETSSGCLSSHAGAVHQDQPPAAIQRYAVFPFVHM